MKSLSTIALLAGLALPALKAQAQTVVVEIDLNTVICALLPTYEEQRACMGDIGYSRTSQAAVELCQGLFSSQAKQQCYSQIQGRFYSNEALKVCKSDFSDSDKLSCLSTIADSYFQQDALRVCKNTFARKANCLNVIKSKTYESYELNACNREFSDQSKMICLQNLGRKLDWQSRRQSYPQPPVIVVPTRPSAPAVAGCEVHNSSSYIETIAERNFEAYARATARDSRSCVVASTISETRSRMLINENGQVIARNLTERETNEYKRAYGYDRCKVLVCR